MSEKEEEVNIVKEFAELGENERRAFINETLEMLVKYSRSPAGIRKLIQWLTPLFLSAMKKPSTDDLTKIQHFTTVILYSIKEEFRYKWAELVHNLYKFKTKNVVPGLANIEEKQKEVDALMWIHAGLSQGTYDKLMKWVIDNDTNDWEDTFKKLLEPPQAKSPPTPTSTTKDT